MVKFVVVCVLVIGLTLQKCGQGCLKCNSKDECIFCDFSNNFYLSGTTCVESTLSYCLTLNVYGECVQCASRYYLDVSTKKCVAVETSKQLENCAYYGIDQVCVKCFSYYYVSHGKCVAVSKIVDNCSSYSDDGQCTACASGYIFNAARNGCTANPQLANCSAYSFLNCKSCASGYITNDNLYFINYETNITAIYSDLKTFTTGGLNDWIAVARCQKIQDVNCLVASAFNVCTTCMPEYFLTADKTCRAYPKPIILGCAIYSSLVECSGCDNGYFLESATKCTLITSEKLISDCSSYSTTAATIQCVQCSTSKFLSENTCTPNNRTDSLNIANCKTTTVGADTCAVCNDGFTTTTDGKKCLAIIANCKTYTSSSSTNTALTCQTCNDSFYLNTDSNSVTTCVPGNIEGCVTYSSKDVCTVCNTASYYSSNSQCVKHVIVPNCVTYSGSNFNKCVSCAAGFYPFTYTTTCSPITVIPNCLRYSSETVCNLCELGYFIQSGKCASVSTTFPNCSSAATDATVCQSCSLTYALKNLDTDKGCALNHNYILDQCDTTRATTFKGIFTSDMTSCRICKENSFPFDLSYLFTCVSNTLLATKGIAGDTLITGCLKYGNNNGNAICLKCPTYLNIPATGARSCVTICDASTSTHIADNLDGSYNTCAPYADTIYGLSNCGQAIKTYNGAAVALVCVKSGAKMLVADFASNLSVDNASSWRDIDGTTVPRPEGAFFYAGIPTTLIFSTNTNKHDTQGDMTGAKNCELYWLHDVNNLLCVRCKWGSSVKYIYAYSKTRCALINECDPTISYTGFSHKLNMVLSCHACTGGKFIQVTALSNETTLFAFIYLENDIALIQCVTPLDAGIATISQPLTVNNCLIYGWLPSTAGGTPIYAKGCLACQPGFTLSANFGTCTAITNCDTTKNYMANRCSECTQVSANGATEWKAFKDYNADTCYVVKSDNCLFADSAASADNDGKYNCKLCKPGYWLNHDKVCEKIILPQCNDVSGATNFYPSTFATSSVEIFANYYAFKWLSKATTVSGCDSCPSGFTGIKMNANENQCVLSPYVQANVYAETTPMKYIPDCSKYNNSLNLLANNVNPVTSCSVCKNNKIPTADGFSCVATIPNCSVAQNSPNTSKCSTCASTHVNVVGVCTLKSIANCLIYETTNPTDLLCRTCDFGLVSSTDKKICYAGNISGCKYYNTDSPNTCNTCLYGYNLITSSNSKTYCIQVSEGGKCTEVDETLATGLLGGFYKCTSCSVDNTAAGFLKAYATSDTTLVQSVCLRLNLVDKCTAYAATAATVAGNTFLCTACSTGFYFDETRNVCIARTVQPFGCTTFYANKDKCQVCNVSTIKTSDETDCVSFPNCILRCATYSDDTVCTSCNAPAYLSNNTCPLSTVISNCATYIANYTCSDCASGFFLNNATSCVQAQASNCLTYSAINACATCDSTKGLKTDTNGVTNCVDKGLSNCNVSTNTFPFTCTQCKSGYYLATDGTCTLPTTINKCVTYDSATTCSKCDKTAVLSVDRKSCNDTMFTGVSDSNCVDNQQVATPICSKCSPGSVFVNGTCSFCSNNTYSAGCFSCDPASQSVLLLCLQIWLLSNRQRCLCSSC